MTAPMPTPFQALTMVRIYGQYCFSMYQGTGSLPSQSIMEELIKPLVGCRKAYTR
ncbi:hypothetical protein D3C73_1675020 [compost metagenome]